MEEAYHKPVVTVWDDGALAGIEAKMSYGGGGSSSGGGGGGIFTTPEVGSRDNPAVLSVGLEYDLSAYSVNPLWLKCTIAGVADIVVNSVSATSIHVYRGAPGGEEVTNSFTGVLDATSRCFGPNAYFICVRCSGSSGWPRTGEGGSENARHGPHHLISHTCDVIAVSGWWRSIPFKRRRKGPMPCRACRII